MTPPPVHPQPFARMGADEALQRHGRLACGMVDPGAARVDPEGRARPGARGAATSRPRDGPKRRSAARASRPRGRRGTVNVGPRAQELHGEGVAHPIGTWSMTMATSSPRRSASCARDIAPAGEATVIRRDARALWQKRSTQPTCIALATTVSGYRSAMTAAASSQFPACAVATTAPRPLATARSSAARRSASSDARPDAGKAGRRASQRSSTRLAPSERYIAEANDRAIPARCIACSTCARRIRRTVPASQPITAPSAENGTGARAGETVRAGVSAEAGTTRRLPDGPFDRDREQIGLREGVHLAASGARVDQLPVGLYPFDARHRERHAVVARVQRERGPFGQRVVAVFLLLRLNALSGPLRGARWSLRTNE